MTTLQNYLRNLCNKGEIKVEFDQMRPTNVKPARVHGLPRIYKNVINIPKFRPIIDTTGSIHYLVGKCLAQLLYLLTNKEFTLKDSFESFNRFVIFRPASLRMGINTCLLMSNHYLPMFPSKTQPTLYSHEYIMTIL